MYNESSTSDRPSGGKRGARKPGVSPGSDPQSQSFITPNQAIHSLRRWWKIAVPTSLILAVAVAAAVYSQFEPVYEASAWLQIEDRPRVLLSPTNLDSEKFVQTQVQLIRSPLILAPVISRHPIATLEELRNVPSPIDWLAQNVRIQSVGNSELFTVSWQSPDPESAEKIVNGIVDEYMASRDKRELSRSTEFIELLRQAADNQRHAVSSLKDNVIEASEDVPSELPLVGNMVPGAAEAQEVMDWQAKLIETDTQLTLLGLTIQAHQQRLQSAAVPDYEIEQALANDAAVVEQSRIVAISQAGLRQLESVVAGGSSSPLVRKKAAEVAEQQAGLDRVRADRRGEISATLKRYRDVASASQLQDLESQKQSLEALRQSFEGKFKKAVDTLAQTRRSSKELEFQIASLKREEDVLDRLEDRLLTLQTELAAPARVTLLRPAEVPTAPVVKSPYKQMGLAGGAAAMLPFVLVMLWERLWRRVASSRELRDQSQLPVIGEIAQLPTRIRGGAARARSNGELQLFQESIDSLRTFLLNAESLQGMRVFAVTSAANNEGKTSIAVQLAVSIARAAGEDTLLIDGDMRSPDVHRILGVSAAPGLAELLAEECTLEEAAITNWGKHVDVLPAGKLTCSPHRLLGNGAFYKLIDNLRQRYHFVVIDTPPVLAASESVVLNRAADGFLLCSMRDVSRLDQIVETRDRLMAAGATPVGTVLNGVPTRQYGYRYGRYSYALQ